MISQNFPGIRRFHSNQNPHIIFSIAITGEAAQTTSTVKGQNQFQITGNYRDSIPGKRKSSCRRKMEGHRYSGCDTLKINIYKTVPQRLGGTREAKRNASKGVWVIGYHSLTGKSTAWSNVFRHEIKKDICSGNDKSISLYTIINRHFPYFYILKTTRDNVRILADAHFSQCSDVTLLKSKGLYVITEKIYPCDPTTQSLSKSLYPLFFSLGNWNFGSAIYQ